MLVAIVLLLSARRRRRLINTAYYVKVDVGLLSESPWSRIKSSTRDDTWVSAISIRLAPFARLVDITTPYLVRGRTGHPNLSPVDVVGLTVMWLTSRLLQSDLSLIFGQSPSIICRELQRGRTALRHALRIDHDSRIEWPDAPTMQRFAFMVQNKRHELRDVFGFMDGVHFPIFNPDNPNEQNAYYNGWVREVSVTNVLVFTPDGCIALARFNCPGSWHDSIVALPIYDVLNDPTYTPPPYRIIADSAFVSTDRCVTCLTMTQVAIASRAALRMNAAVVSVRQAAEWGNGALQRTFARLKLPLSADADTRASLLHVVFHLYNLRTRLTGFNQIKSVFCDN